MSPAGRRRPEPTDDPGATGGPSGAPRHAARVTAGLTFVTLVAAAVVPAAVLHHREPPRERPGSRPPAAGALRAAAAPTDMVRSRQWYLNAMRVPRAWRWGRGRDVTVAVLDTGVDGTHKDLTGQVIDGPDYTGGNRQPGGRYWGGHGTAMAGIIAGHGNGPGQSSGVMGIAPRAKVLSIRVTWENDDPLRQNGNLAGQSRDAVAKGIRYAVDNGADIINMSLGGGRAFYNGNTTEEQAVRYALSKGVVLIASAGNDGSGPNRKNFPAAYPGVIAVGALNKKMRPWEDTNRNSYVSVCAPGVDIISPAPGDKYVLGTGTSPSSAIVAGVAALIRARFPRLTPDEVRQALVRGVVQRGEQSGQAATGAQVCSGSLDALRAMQVAAQISKAAHGPEATAEPTTAPPAATAEPPAEESDTLLWAVVAGGGAMVVTGLLLGWRQRRRSRGEEEDGFVAAPPEPVAAAEHAWPAEPHDRRVAPLDWPEREEPAESWPSEPAAPHVPTSDSGTWMPQPDLHLPPAGEVPAGTPNGNGNGHHPLDPENLRPYDPAGEPETESFPSVHARPQADDPVPGFGDDPLSGSPFGEERAVPRDDDAPLDFGRDVPVVPESRHPEPPFALPGFEPPAVPETGTGPVDPASPTAPFRAVNDQDLAWPVTRPEEDDPAPALRADEDDLATRAFPAVDPGTAQEADRRGARPEDDDQRPSWW
ncbi:S8 family peptidase [Thermomonospora cellulosilytica]|uniref:Type VII secretion-associated serine protease mycosin n=1 Tax=Thermomonospora cellulosilytica TaxID=1411118 RepID=A0A7W3R854_9ACTN|nr:S8 family peptidase [Thermomonospora cellulosilytica]MBA9003331.1 type VII secretion-associated serine protease mycosin [Thermomonospora cellulosilytica]